MRRVGVLVLAFIASLVTVALTIVFIPCSGEQQELRLEAGWPLGGRLELAGARTFATRNDAPWNLDLATVTFTRLSVLGSRAERIVGLSDVEWKRPHLVPGRTPADLSRSTIRFDRGEMNLSRAGGSTWNFGTLVQNVPDWVEQLPADITGRELALTVEQHSSSRRAALLVTLRDIEFGRDGAATVIRARIDDTPAAPPAASAGGGDAQHETRDKGAITRWAHANAEIRHAGDDWKVRLIFDDATLPRFPFADLQTLFGFPWPTGLVPVHGRAFLDWNTTRDSSRLDVDYYGTELALPGLAAHGRVLGGEAIFDRGSITWKVDRGLYSHSGLRASLTIQGPAIANATVEGSVELSDFVEDRALGLDFPGLWGACFQATPLTGQGNMVLALEGALQDALRTEMPWQLVEEVALGISGVSLRGLTPGVGGGQFKLTPVDGAWQLAGTSEDLEIFGVRLAGGEWRGTFGGGRARLTLQSSSEAATPELVIDAHTVMEDGNPAAASAIEFNVELRGTLSGWLALPLGPSPASLVLRGTWSKTAGWRIDCDGQWREVQPGDSVRWPRRPAQGDVEGEAHLRFEGDRWHVLWLGAVDGGGAWLAQGEIEDGEWSLTGCELPGTKYLPFPDLWSELIELSDERFQLRGSVLTWEETPLESRRGAEEPAD